MPTLNMKQLGKMFKKLPAEVRRDVDRGVRLAAQRGRTHLVSKTPVDQGQAKIGWKATATTITNAAPHIGILEKGARPHKVSKEGIDAIARWAERVLTVRSAPRKKRLKKHGPTKPKKQGPTKPKTPGKRRSVSAKQAMGIAYAIAAKLEKDGQPGTFFVQKSLPKIAKFLNIEIEAQLRRRAK